MGGKREGAGRKARYTEPTKTIAFRVPFSKIVEIKKLVTQKLNSWKK